RPTVERFERQERDGRIVLTEVLDPSHLQHLGVPAFDPSGGITRVIEKPQSPPSRFAVTGIYFYQASVFDILPDLKPSNRGEQEIQITVLDKLTYAGSEENLAEVSHDTRLRFVQGDICDAATVEKLAAETDAIVNFAAETHVDRSLLDAGGFVQTDVYGTYVLLEAVRKLRLARFLQVSTDEVYGYVKEGKSRETDALLPRSPYAASKAGAEMLVRAYHASYGLPAVITRGANTYGPYQFPEKIVPLFITNALQDLPLPVYGK